MFAYAASVMLHEHFVNALNAEMPWLTLRKLKHNH